MHVQRTAVQIGFVAPDRLQNIGPGQGAVQVAEQQARQGELLGGQHHGLAVARHGAGGFMEDGVAQDLGARRGRLGIGAAHQGIDAGGQNRRGQGLGQVVVGAGVQARHDVLVLGAAGDQQHRRRRAQIGARPGQDLKSGAVRQVPVHDEEVESVLA
ncbi:hypothetical protein D3C72_1543540 [compost metagenome]